MLYAKQPFFQFGYQYDCHGSGGADAKLPLTQRGRPEHGIEEWNIDNNKLQGQGEGYGREQKGIAEPGIGKQRLFLLSHAKGISHLAEGKHGKDHGLPGT